MTIREARKQAGLTLQAASDYLQVPMRTLQHWEAGDRKCPPYVERLIIKELLAYK